MKSLVLSGVDNTEKFLFIGLFLLLKLLLPSLVSWLCPCLVKYLCKNHVEI